MNAIAAITGIASIGLFIGAQVVDGKLPIVLEIFPFLSKPKAKSPAIKKKCSIENMSIFFVQGNDPLPKEHVDAAKAMLKTMYNTQDVNWVEEYSKFEENMRIRMADIAAKRSNYSPLIEPDGVNKLFDDVKKKLAGGRKVLLIGHSYGSVSAMLVAERLNKNKIVPNLLVVTLGGLLADKLQFVKTLHVMMVDDISLDAFVGIPANALYVDHNSPKQTVQERRAVHYLYFKEPYSQEIGDLICKEAF